jgi:hypothetical protein
MAVNGLISLLALILLVCVFYGPWQAACTDWARQVVFERRDRLFDLAAQGSLEFTSDNYRALRAGLEGMIRFAHELTWPRLLFHVILRKRMGVADRHALTEAIACIEDPTVRRQVTELIAEATFGLIIMMLLKSIVIAPVAFLAWCIAMCSSGFKYFIGNSRNSATVRSLSETIQAEAQLA